LDFPPGTARNQNCPAGLSGGSEEVQMGDTFQRLLAFVGITSSFMLVIVIAFA
jgi:hypothetical protein